MDSDRGYEEHKKRFDERKAKEPKKAPATSRFDSALEKFHSDFLNADPRPKFDCVAYQQLLEQCTPDGILNALLKFHEVQVRASQGYGFVAAQEPLVAQPRTVAKPYSTFYCLAEYINEKNLQTWIEKINPFRFGKLLSFEGKEFNWDNFAEQLSLKNKTIPLSDRKEIATQLDFLQKLASNPAEEYRSNPLLFMTNFNLYVKSMPLTMMDLKIQHHKDIKIDTSLLLKLAAQVAAHIRQLQDRDESDIVEAIRNFRTLLHFTLAKLFYVEFLQNTKKDPKNLVDATRFFVSLPIALNISPSEQLEIAGVLFAPRVMSACPREIADPYLCQMRALEHAHHAAMLDHEDAMEFLLANLDMTPDSSKSFPKFFASKAKPIEEKKTQEEIEEDKKRQEEILSARIDWKKIDATNLDDGKPFSIWTERQEILYQIRIDHLWLARIFEIAAYLKTLVEKTSASKNKEGAVMQLAFIAEKKDSVVEKERYSFLANIQDAIHLLKDDLLKLKAKPELIEAINREYGRLVESITTLQKRCAPPLSPPSSPHPKKTP